MPSASADRRRMGRQRRRLQVRLEANGLRGAGFTSNVSPAGIQVQAKISPRPGTIVHGEMLLPGGTKMDFDMEVRWVNRVIGQLAQLVPNSMGLRFVVPPSEAYFQLLANTPAAKQPP